MTMENTQLICLAGSGGTGKTSVAETATKLFNKPPERTMPYCELHSSVVREYYAWMQVRTEEEFSRLSAQEKLDFQLGLLKFYLEKLTTRFRETPSGVLLCDRSVFDHVAYTVYANPTTITPSTMEVLRLYIEEFLKLNPRVFYLPYPPPWLDKCTDGFRQQLFSKDFCIDAVIHKLLTVYGRRRVWAGTLSFKPVEERAIDLVVESTRP